MTQCLIVIILLFLFTYATGDDMKWKVLHKIDLIKRKHTLMKFEQQLISSLSVPPASNIDETARQKWMQLPEFIRRRLVASKVNVEHSEMDTKEIFVPVIIAQKCIANNFTAHHVCVHFKLDQRTLQSRIRAAILYLDLPHVTLADSTYTIQQDRQSSNDALKFSKQNSNLLQVNIHDWISSSDKSLDHSNHQFVVTCNGQCNNDIFAGAQLFLEVELGTNNRKRSKRSIDESVRTCTQDEIMCCKRSFVFRPVDIGWNWIVHPEEIRLNYCTGECNEQTSNYTYSRILSLLKRSKNANLTPHQLESMKFCCAPKSYSGINVVYLTNTNNSFQETHLSNMIVDNCACV